MPEDRESEDDRQRDAQKPKQSASSKTHDFLLSVKTTNSAEEGEFH
jgi:hypothetical protein